MTTLQSYQNLALRTAMPEAFQHDYLIPSIVGEIGELFGKRGKAVRDRWSQDRLDQELALEYGDVAWMVAVLLEMNDVHSIPDTVRRGRLIRDPWHRLLLEATFLNGLHSILAGNWSITDRATRLWLELETNCKVITGVEFGEVLRLNAEKLLSRKERGTLTGSGDNR